MKETSAHELMRLVCSVCGPLTLREVERFFPDLGEVEGVERRLDLYRVSQSHQPDMPALWEAFRRMPMLGRICSDIVKQREKLHGGWAYVSQRENAAAASRFAILKQDEKLFSKHYREGIRRYEFGSRSYMEHEEYWNILLGDRWLGAEYVPYAEAKQEIMSMMASRFALRPMPSECRLVISCVPQPLALGYSLLRADTSVRPLPESADAGEQEAAMRRAESRAYWSLWSGEWERAYENFREIFKVSETTRHEVISSRSAPLLVLALIIAVRVHANHRTVEMWARIAREIMLGALAVQDAQGADELTGFFDALETWDAIENRGSRHCELPHAGGALAYIPLAIGAQSIVQNTGANLPLGKLVQAVREVHDRGLRLLSLYAASALINLPGLSDDALELLSSILNASSFQPLYERCEQAIQAGELRWNQLCGLLDSMHATHAQWLFWDITLDKYGYITRLEPRLVEKKPQANGRRLEPDEVMDATRIDCQESCDYAALAISEALQKHGEQSPGILPVAALAGHPRLRLLQAGYRRLVKLGVRRPYIQVMSEGSSVQLFLDKKQFMRVLTDDAGNVTLPAFTPRMQVLIDFFSEGPISLDISQREKARWMLARLSESFCFRGKFPGSLLHITPSRGRVFAQASCVGSTGCHIALQVEHHASSSTYTTPGQGEAVLLIKTGQDGELCVRRDLRQELSVATVLVSGSALLSSGASAQEFRWRFASRLRALQALYDLKRAGIQVEWKGKSRDMLTVHEAELSSLQLSVQREHADWLEIGAELPVDESRVLSLSALLEAYRKREGEFLPISARRFLHMSPELGAQLEQLDTALRREKRHYVLPHAALPALAAQWAGKLPPAITHRCELLHECDDALPPQGFGATLREYQLTGFRWLLARARAGLGACLADDMGLGKTVQVLALLLACAAEGPSLVVTPLSLRANWLAEAARFAKSLRMVSFADARRLDSLTLGAGDVLVASYGQVAANEEFFAAASRVWAVAVLDEAQAIKNPSSRRAQAVNKLHATARVCMTGTPVENSLLDLWSLMHFLNPHLLGSRAGFTRGGKELAERVRTLTAPLMLRRTKEEVLPQLPPITEVEIGVELSAEERALYESCRRRACRSIRASEEPVTLLAELTRLRRLCCHGSLALSSFRGESSKLKAMVELVEELREANHRALVFSQFTDVLDLAEAALSHKGVTTLRLDGSMSPAKRAGSVKRFQEGKAQVFLISLKAGGAGLNLTAADYVILLDPWWNPAVEAQAAGRSHRIGQHNPVTVCRLIARDTVEERMMQMHEAKVSLADSVMSGSSAPLEALREILLGS